MQVDAGTASGNLGFDHSVALQNTVVWNTATCASRLAFEFGLAFFNQGVFISTQTVVDAQGNVTIKIVPPPGDPFTYGGMWISICAP